MKPTLRIRRVDAALAPGSEMSRAAMSNLARSAHRPVLRLLRRSLLAACAMAVPAADASAAVTVGQNVAPSAGVTCNGDSTVIQTQVASGNSYVMPFHGVITSWTAFGGESRRVCA